MASQESENTLDFSIKGYYNRKLQMNCIFERLRMAKEYKTKSKQQIMDYITAQQDKHFSAQQVYDYLSGEKTQINLATVYRNLDKLAEDGVLLRYKSMGSNSVMYQYAVEDKDCHNHLHMQCNRCGRIIHLECEFMHEIEEHLMREHDFSLVCEGSVILGICKECKKKEA